MVISLLVPIVSEDCRYNTSKWLLELFSFYHRKKDISDYLLDGEDNELYALPIGMPAGTTFIARVQYQLHKYLTLNLACENITDLNYRVFVSGVHAPGRNIHLTLRYAF